ncbi:MAG: c-type cytochrome biogenesis protein CcmI [Gammaproteobacteria bacterium]|nr:c-type cytochrome biogenesis protein CcmI [Gammaproteobacteria bacterium]
MMFYLVLFLLCLVAAAFVLAPILLRGRDDEIDRQAVNLDLYREHLSNLSMEPEEAELVELEARRSLLGDVADDSVALIADTKPRWLILCAVLVPILALLLYADFGAGRGAISDVRLTERLESLDTSDAESVDNIVDQLAERAQARPKDGELSFYVARSYSSLGRHKEAIVVYKRLLNLYPDDASLHAYYAETLFVADERRMTPRVKTAVEEAMELNPHDIVLLEIQGIAAISEGRPEDALDWFSQALATGVTGQRADVIRGAVAAIHKQLGIAAVSIDGPAYLSTLEIDASRIVGTFSLYEPVQR